ISMYMFVFFFFQAEDGIRDFHVTGVQTCALPISDLANGSIALPIWCAASPTRTAACAPARSNSSASAPRFLPRTSRPEPAWKPRSEERRVGKEGRSRGSSAAEKKEEEIVATRQYK